MEFLMNLALSLAVVQNERMPQQPRGGPAATWVPLQTAVDEVSEISGRRGRCLRRLRHTNGAHQAGPVALPPHREGESAHVELQDAHPEAPYVPQVPIVLAVV